MFLDINREARAEASPSISDLRVRVYPIKYYNLLNFTKSFNFFNLTTTNSSLLKSCI